MIRCDLQDQGEFSVPLLADTPKTVQRAIDVRTYAYSTVVVTPAWFQVNDLSDANFLANARYVGVYLGQSDDRLTLNGAGVVWWLGQENDNGDMYAGVDTTSAALTFAAQLDARIFTSAANGLTRGTTNALATTRTIKIEGNVTRRVLLDTICALYNSTPFEWRVNTNFSVDLDTQANLYATATTPLTLFAQEGGRDGAINGLHADLNISTIDVEDYRTEINVRWNEATPGTNNGSATNAPTSTWVDVAGGTPDLRSVIDWRPRKGFREHPNRSDRYNGSNYGAYVADSQTQANQIATAHANQTNSYAIEIDAKLDEYDPWRFFDTGHSVWVWDPPNRLTDSANEVYYRGAALNPQKLRVQSFTTPIQDGYGVYLRYWNGSSFSYYDLTPYVAFEEQETTVELGSRARFHPKNARPKRFNQRRVRHQARDWYILNQYLQRVG